MRGKLFQVFSLGVEMFYAGQQSLRSSTASLQSEDCLDGLKKSSEEDTPYLTVEDLSLPESSENKQR